MKNFFKIFLFPTVFLFSSAFSTALAEGYNLNCLAGGNMGLTYNASTKKVKIHFTPAPQGTRTQGLSHGQCSWPGRKFRSNEPRTICHYNVMDVIVKNNARSFSLSSRRAPYMRKIKDGGYFSMKVTNRNNCMEVLRVNRVDRAVSSSDDR